MTCVWQKKSTQGWFGRPHPDRKHTCVQLQGFGRPRNTHVCPRKNKLRVARKDLGIKKYKGLAPTSCCCEHTHVCCRISKLRLHPGIRGLQGLGRPGAAGEKTPFVQGCTQGSKVVWGRPTNCCCEHTHVCMAESHVNSRLAPRIKKVQEFGRPTAAASIHICVSETVPGCTQGSQVTRDWPTNCDMSSQGCTQGPRVTSAWPTACCCEHTRVCCKIKSIQGCTQGRHVTRVRPTRRCCEPTHMRCRIFLFNVARTGQKIICRCEHTYTHVCFRTSQFKLAHQKQKVQGLGQSDAAVSVHVRAAG